MHFFISLSLLTGCYNILSAPDEDWDFETIYVTPNFDDDDSNGIIDFQDTDFRLENDFSILTIPAAFFQLPSKNYTTRLLQNN
ncbi:MAG: hypothetical protein VX278_16150, partial [Myxococcota bacterium]|nr:hypothetical protein [Myxococcota bacterium]